MNDEWMEVLALLDEQAVEQLTALAGGLLRGQEGKELGLSNL